MTIYNLYICARICLHISASLYSIKEEKILEMSLFLVSRFLNAVERVECRNMCWHLGKRALMAANNRI